MKEIVLSVHGLVDFLLRRGSIDNRIYNNASMAEGSRIHLRYQKIQGGTYLSEEALEISYQIDDYLFKLNGRADGIILDKIPVIDEIKTTVVDLEEFYESQKDWHLGQAKVYAYMYAKKNNIDYIKVRLTYISQKDDSRLIKEFAYTKDELESYVINLLKDYLKFYKIILEHDNLKVQTANTLKFPYESYRKGQRELSKYVYGTIKNEDTLFIEAPTGIGKTMSTLFPAVKTFGTENTEKIFYLSAKTIAKEVAYEAMKRLIKHGQVARTIKLTAKEKMCQAGHRKCNPLDCPFANGYYDKIKNVLLEIVKNEELIDDKIINKYANNNDMCAYELQLDTSLFCDVIICDYNYFFDPLVYLKRFFETDKVPYVALIDETHNLVDRSRDMYSADFDFHKIKLLQKQFKPYRHPKMKRAMKKVINYLENITLEQEEYIISEPNFSNDLYAILENFFKQMQDVLKNYSDYVTDLFLEVFRMTNKFIKISEFVGKGFKTYYVNCNKNLIARIKCLDSSSLIEKTLKKLKSAIFFSATLTPLDYYVQCLGGNDDTPFMTLESPFDSNRCLTIIRSDISTRYKDREYSYEEIARSIQEVIKGKKGNYLVFFSSYTYLENVASYLHSSEKEMYIQQTRDMSEEEKGDFLRRFDVDNNQTLVGLAVLGGAFSEGIDLVGEKLIGAIIVGVGLPQVSFERDLIKDYFDNNDMSGYDYSYVNPGINKILQAAGRVIRSENDKGIVMFIDDRYKQRKYKEVIQREYKNNYYVSSNKEIKEIIDDFWKST